MKSPERVLDEWGDRWNEVVSKVQKGFKLHGMPPTDYSIAVMKNLANMGIDFITMVTATDEVLETAGDVMNDDQLEQLEASVKEARQAYNDYLTQHPEELQRISNRALTAAPIGQAARLHDKDVNAEETSRIKRNKAREDKLNELDRAATTAENKLDTEVAKRNQFDKDRLGSLLS